MGILSYYFIVLPEGILLTRSPLGKSWQSGHLAESLIAALPCLT